MNVRVLHIVNLIKRCTLFTALSLKEDQNVVFVINSTAYIREHSLLVNVWFLILIVMHRKFELLQGKKYLMHKRL